LRELSSTLLDALETQKTPAVQSGGARRGRLGELQNAGDVFSAPRATYLIRVDIGAYVIDQQTNHNNNM
jgi:hypothetical protein